MTTLREYFDAEAADYLRRLAVVLAESNAGSEIVELHRLARGLRGIAQLARENHVVRAATAFEAAARALTEQSARWDEEARAHLRQAVESLTALTQEDDDEERREAYVKAVVEECLAVGPAIAEADAAAELEADAERLNREFREYVARESEAIAGVLDESIGAFGRDPMDREALRAVLRRHRALLGAARLEEVRIVAQSLRAVEDIAGIIGKINTPIKKEWLDVFRCARDVLRNAADPLRRGEDPRPSNSLSRLRTLHEELVDRYGAVDPVSPAVSHESLLSEMAAQAKPKVSTDIGELVYRGPAALRRALELRPRLEQALREEPGARELLDELFDLIRLGLE
jgi:chemotaxis protein histidine kinase CheA